MVSLLLSLAALGLASGAYLGKARQPVRATDRIAFSSIEPIYRQISAQAGPDTPVHGSSPFIAGDVPFAATFLHVDQYPGTEEDSDPAGVSSANSSLIPAGVTVSRIGGTWPTAGPIRRPAMPDDLTGAAALVFNNSFSSLFSRVFEPQSDESNRSAELAADTRNPFSEAKQKEDAAGTAAASQAAATQEKAAPEPQPADSSAPEPQAATASGSGARPEKYVFLGDFDGSGVLSILTAERAEGASFKFDDGFRTFSLFMSPSAVSSQRSLALEDINGDGIMDLLVTARAGLFGGVLVGDGEGGFRPAGTFLTGYEPVLAAVGPEVEGGREIVTVDTRSGAVTRFIPRGAYQRQSAGKLDFIPDYINHIVQPEQGADYLQIAKAGGEPRLYEWPSGGKLKRRSLTLPPASALQAGPDPDVAGGIGLIRIYQVGAYASIVLADGAGKSFNVANLKVSPQACLVLGDLEGHGNLDVGVAHLVSFTPSK